MKKLILLPAIILMSSCTTTQVSQWWNNPSTQAGVATAERLAISFAENVALAALQQYAGGGSIDFTKLAIQGGAGTLYTQANYIRSLQGTNQVLDPTALADALESGGTPKQISQKTAQQLYDNAVAAMHAANLTPDQASELNAKGLDRAASVVAKSDPSASLFK